MPDSYYEKYFLGLWGCVILCGLTLLFVILLIAFKKKVFKKNEFYKIKLAGTIIILLVVFLLSMNEFGIYIADYKYVKNKTYEEDVATLIGFKRKNETLSGAVGLFEPIFYLEEENKEITFKGRVRDMNVGQAYLIRYWPNTKLFFVVEELELNEYFTFKEVFYF